MRRQMLCSAAAIAIITAISGPVAAADLVPVKARTPTAYAPTWSGLYIGGHVGYGWANFRGGVRSTGNSLPVRNFTAEGFGVGLHAGYNLQAGAWVYGIEGDVTATPGWNKRRCVTSGACYSENHAVGQLDALASIRGRLGMVFGNNLLYATGGVAFARRQLEAGSTDIAKRSGIRIGAVVGAGLEHKYNSQVNLRLEGLHYMFNEKNSTNIDPDRVAVYNFRTATVVRLGASWQLTPQ